MIRRKNIIIETWTKSNGNPCFRFPLRDSFERPWIIVLVTVFLISISGVEFLFNQTYYSILPNLLIWFFIFVWWISTPLKSNERIITKTVHEIMDSIVADDAKIIGAQVVNSKVHNDVKGTYGIVTASILLVLLDNGKIWEYQIIYHKPDKNQSAFFECEKDHSESVNEEHIKAISHKKKCCFAEYLKLTTKAKMTLVLLIILAAGCLAFVLLYYLIIKYTWWTLAVVAVYGIVRLFVGWLANKLSYKTTDVLIKIVDLPLVSVNMIVGVTQPFVTIVGTYFMVAIYAFGLPALVLSLLTYVCGLELKSETIVFIVVSLGSILCAHSYKATKWIIHQTPLQDQGNHTYESYKESLAIYLMHPSNVIALLYSVYFVFLAISGYLQIQNETFLLSKQLDASIMKAFLVFIAFTNMRIKVKEADMDIQILLRRTMQLFERDK